MRNHRWDTCIQILKARGREPAPEKFHNGKGYYSLNLFSVVDHKLTFRYFTARHCGSALDAKIFNESRLRTLLFQRFNPQKPLALIGDKGYGCEDIMLTPYKDSKITQESDYYKRKMIAYNKSLSKVRVGVERAFGVLKKRFPVLLYQLRNPEIESIQTIIASVIVLHNFLID